MIFLPATPHLLKTRRLCFMKGVTPDRCNGDNGDDDDDDDVLCSPLLEGYHEL